MIEVESDPKPAQDRFENMLMNIADVKAKHMAEEFLAWQGEDLNRASPRIDERTPISVMTKVAERKASYRLINVQGRKRRVRTRIRPILRPVLFQRLCARMADMMKKYLTWR
jgi:hypothetical protein